MPTDAPSPSSTATGSDGTVCPYTVFASVATESQRDRIDRHVDAANLSAPRRAEFERMVESGSVSLETLPETWASPVLVDYRGETYYVVAQTC